MTPTALITVDGHPVRGFMLRVGPIGPWFAEIDLADDAQLSGRVTLKVADTTLSGTVVERGTFALQTGIRIVAGAGAWGQTLSERGYHNDAGVKASLLAQDAAREVGETLGTFQPVAERVGIDYARTPAAASTVLEYAAGGTPWWVDFAGVTHVMARATSELEAASYLVTMCNARERVADVAVDDISKLTIGSILRDERFDGPQVVYDIEFSTRDNSPLRASVWLGGLPNEASRLAGLLRSIITRAVAGELPGIYRYRVVTMLGDGRCDLQSVRRQTGLPDLRSVSQWPGIPGASATLTLGAEVLVQFVDADPAQPLISGYIGPGGGGFAPQQLILGGDAGQPAARQGDSVQVLIPPAQFAGTIGGAPATGVVSWLTPTADGTITGGSGRVRIAT